MEDQVKMQTKFVTSLLFENASPRCEWGGWADAKTKELNSDF